jgi:hypothetical protein
VPEIAYALNSKAAGRAIERNLRGANATDCLLRKGPWSRRRPTRPDAPCDAA